jgi:mannose-6-phosphate isomerase-like protein (cupin superfamily)
MPSTEPFVAIHVDAVPAGPDRGTGIGELKPVRRHFGIEAFGANARVAREAGEVLVMPHDERAGGPWGTEGHEELYAVLRGHATFTLDGQEVDAPAGTLLFVRDPAVERSAVAAEPDTAILAVGGPPGAAFRVAPWEQRDIDAYRP